MTAQDPARDPAATWRPSEGSQSDEHPPRTSTNDEYWEFVDHPSEEQKSQQQQPPRQIKEKERRSRYSRLKILCGRDLRMLYPITTVTDMHCEKLYSQEHF